MVVFSVLWETAWRLREGKLLTSFKAAQPLLRRNEAAWRLIYLCIIVSICVCFPAHRCRLQQTSQNRHRGGQGRLLEGGVPLADVWLCILRSESTRDRGADWTHFFVFIQSSGRHLFSKQNVFSLVFINCFSANVRTRSPRHCFDRYQQARPHHQPPQDEGEEVVFNKSISSSTLVTFTLPSFNYFFFSCRRFWQLIHSTVLQAGPVEAPIFTWLLAVWWRGRNFCVKPHWYVARGEAPAAGEVVFFSLTAFLSVLSLKRVTKWTIC